MKFRFRNLILLAALLTALALPAAVRADEEVIDSIAAIVDQEIILESDVAYGVNTLLLESGIRYPPADKVAELRRQVVDAYITQKVLLAKAAEETLNVEDRVVDKELDKKIKALTAQVGSEEKLVEYFGKPLAKIRREMREGVRDGLLIDMLKQRKIMNVHVRRLEVLDFYAENRDQIPEMPEKVTFSHILIEVKPSPEARAQADARITRLRDLLLAGADFDSLAKAESDGPSAPEGGRLGFTNRGDLVPSYEEAAYALDPGQISEVVETPFGLHLIKLIERQGERISSQHILIQLTPTVGDWEQARVRADSLRGRILAGEAFSDMARKYSDDEDSAPKGGHFDPIAASELPVEFAAAIGGLEVGEISELFRTTLGMHIVRLDDRKAAREVNPTDDWALLEMYALGQERERVFNEWVAEMKKNHYIWP